MSRLDYLVALLQVGIQEGAKPMQTFSGIDDVLAEMASRAKSKTTRSISKDHQLEAVCRFWDSREVSSFRDALLLSWGLCLPHHPMGPCLLEDHPRFQQVLDSVDRYSVQPSAYRRCYQGLVRSYFTYDALSDSVPLTGRNNWKLLRDYLRDRNNMIRGAQINPEWIETAIGNRQLFGDNPCEPYVEALLRGDVGGIDHLCEQLGIGKASWFLRELVLAQVRGATQLGHEQFKELMPRLLELLAKNVVLRDRGIALILDRYVNVPGAHLHQRLREASVQWWGNPWLPSSETHWGAVVPNARTMVADWLKLEFIETFFTKLAEDGLGDRRRMEFWKRYVKAIHPIEFALGSTARSSRERDFVMLRDKMKGLTCDLDASGANNAFIMGMGDLVVVEFSGMGNALYGYDASKSLPFDSTKTLHLAINDPNSLKHKPPRRVLWLQHQDGIHGWEKWEQMFEATLRQEFGIKPEAELVSGTRPIIHASRSNSASHSGNAQLYSRKALDSFVNAHGFRIEDKTLQGGCLWVRAGVDDAHISGALTQWGFHYKAGKGWWK
ncbi:EH signature domain-containing protein [Pseudomonas frederiksbergensis]|nr:EH signature domain-containing protein [Pseudomonas frederiksbergensis]